MNASLSPIKHSPPANTVGIVMLMAGDLKRFKFAFHSILSFTDYPYMLTVVESMQTLTVRNYLRAIQRNHPINVLQYNDHLTWSQQFDLGLKYLFTFPSVRFGCVIAPGIIVEPEWLSPIVARLQGEQAQVSNIGQIHVSAPCRVEENFDLCVFKRDAYESVGSYSREFSQSALDAGWVSELAQGIRVHSLNGGPK